VNPSAAVKAALRDLLQVTQPGDTVVFFAASHGLPNAMNKFDIVLHDTEFPRKKAGSAKDSLDFVITNRSTALVTTICRASCRTLRGTTSARRRARHLLQRQDVRGDSRLFAGTDPVAHAAQEGSRIFGKPVAGGAGRARIEGKGREDDTDRYRVRVRD
jgi:hypothetical protein